MDDEEETYFSRRSSTPSIGSLGDEDLLIPTVEAEEEEQEDSDESVTFEPSQLLQKSSLIPAHVLEAAKQALIFDEEEEEDRKKSRLEYDVEDDDQEIVGQVYVDIRPGDKEIVRRHYDPAKYTSRPQLSPESTIHVDALSLVYSFGYDCHRLYNLCVPDPDHLLYICGNYIHIFDVYEGTFVFKRSAGGGGLGHIAKHPHEPIIAVGERGPNPLIILYEWPSLDIINILEGGAKQGYNYISFSPSGDWLVSQGGNPDNMLVIWNWQRSRIILRGKAYGQDVYRVDFNPILNQELTTSGMAHIKFWKMAQTFTGLKLSGMIGKFGKTEICDVSTFFTLPRGEVASASSWGTMLIWEGDRILLEVVRKNGLPMHAQAITYFEYRETDGELLTVGMEGKFKVWHYLSIEEAPPSEEKKLELQPRFVRRIRDEIGYAHPIHVVPRNPADKQSFFYYMQDITGTIWLTEMAVKKKLEQPTRLLRFHSGPIGDVAPSPCDYYLASLGEDGFLHIRNVNKKKIILIKDFGVRGSSLLWLPISVDRTGCVLIMGFGDGTVRVAILSIRAKELNADGLDEDFITVVQAFKPHYEEVTCISLDPHRDLVVTASLDGNIFLHSLQGLKEYLILEPIGLVRMPGPIYFLTWNPNKEAILVTCTNATAGECTIPEVIPSSGDETYELYLPVKEVHFKSVKSEILRDEVIQRVEKKRAEKIAERKAKMEKLQTTTPMMFMDDAMFIHDGEDEEEIPEVYIPEIPSTLYFGRYLSEDNVWFSAGGYDAGYVYEYLLGTNKPTRSTPLDLPGAGEMTCYTDLFDGEYLILGTDVGSIKLVKTNPKDHTDLTDYWEFNMHDVKVKKVVLTYDSRMLYSIADDSNIFLYNINLDSSKFKERKNLPQLRPAPYEHKIDGIIGPDEKSLEQHKAIAQQMKLKKMGEEKKVLLKERMRILVNRFDYIFSLNRDLPDSQRMPDSFFEVDPTISKILEENEREVKILGLKKYEYEFWKSKVGRDKVYNFFMKPVKTFKFYLNGIGIRARVSTFYQAKLSLAYLECEREAGMHVEEVVKKGRSGRLKVRELENEEDHKRTRHSTGPGQLIRGIDSILPRLGRNERALYLKLEQRRSKRLLLRRQLDDFRESQPIMKNLFLSLNLDKAGKPNEAAFLLKIHPDYRTPRHARLSKAQKFSQLLDTRRRIYKLVDEFNTMVLAVRKKKMDLIKYYNECEKAVGLIREEFGDIPLLKFPEKPVITDEEFPEKIYKDDERTYLHEMPVADPTPDPEFYLAYKMDQKFPIDNKIRTSSFMIWSDGLDLKYLTDQVSNEYTIWERELIFRRMCRTKGSVLKMKRIINDMITEYDTEVARLQSIKIDYEKRITLLKIHLLKQCEELQIIRGIQTLEDVIHKRISVFIIQKHIYILRMNIRKNKIKKCEDNIISSTNNIKLLASEFADNIAESRWARHLAKIFRKKYRPPRKPDEESESESSSSDDDDDDDYDEDEESEMEMGAYQFDETIMPDGCDPQVFENTFLFRNRRHMEEIRISECRLRTLSLQKEIDGLRRVLLTIETILSIFQAKLDTLLKEKQTEMNGLKTLVVLDSYQMQHYNPEKLTFQPLHNTLLYPVEGLRNLRIQLAKLNEQEGLFKEAKQDCKNHVKRIQLDIIFLKDKLIELEKNIREAKVLKFGAHLNLEKMEETLMRRIVKEYRYSSISIHRYYYREMLRLKSDILENQELLSDEYKVNTREQLKLSALEEQKNEYLKLITKIKHELKKEKEITEEELEQDIKHLNDIKRVQSMMKTALKNEIEQYKLKNTYLAQIGRKSQYFTEKPALSRSSVDDSLRVTTPTRKTPEEEKSQGEASATPMKDIGKRREEEPKVKESESKTDEREGGGTADEEELEISELGMSEEGAQVGGSEATERTGVVEEMGEEGLSEEERTGVTIEEVAEEEAGKTSEEEKGGGQKEGDTEEERTGVTEDEEVAEEEAGKTSEEEKGEGQKEGDTEEEKSEVTEDEEKTETEEKAEVTGDEGKTDESLTEEGDKTEEEGKTDEAATEGEITGDEGQTDEAATEEEKVEVTEDEGKTDEAATEGEETEVTEDEPATEGEKVEVTEDEEKSDVVATEGEETEVTGDEAATEGEKVEGTEDEGKTDEAATEGEETEVTEDDAATEGEKVEVTEDEEKTDVATEEETEVTGDEAATKVEVTEDEEKTDVVATEGEETEVTGDEAATEEEKVEGAEDEEKTDEAAIEEETTVTGDEGKTGGATTEGEKVEEKEEEGKTDIAEEGKTDEAVEEGKLKETEEGVENTEGIADVEVETTGEKDKDEETAENIKKEEQEEPVEEGKSEVKETAGGGGDVGKTAEIEKTEDTAEEEKEPVEAEGDGA